MEKVNHELEPVFDNNSKILILGTMPSVKSREAKFYYAHPQNRFWKILSNIYNEDIPLDNKKKEEFIRKKHIALWDVIKSCEINGSSDSSITKVIPNDINYVLKNSNVKTIFVTGKKAYELYNKYCFKDTKIECIYLPSPSPANCKLKLEEIIEEYRIIIDYL